MSGLTRRQLLRAAGAGALALCRPGALLPRMASAAVPHDRRRAPFFDVPDDELINLRGQQLRFGSTIYPWKEPEWILEECRAIGFTGVRLSLPREHVEHGPNDGAFDPRCFHNPFPAAIELVRRSKLDVVMTVHGHPADRKAVPLEWIRNADGTINGKANARSFGNYTRWLVNHTKDFVQTYELWNEAFGSIEDQKFHRSFGPGGSLQNADQYADMMLPAMAAVKECAPHARTAIEGNYWGIQDSVARSESYQRLLAQADFAVYHPYNYGPKQYTKEGKKAGGLSQFYEANGYYRSINPRIEWFFTEYNVEARGLGLPPEQERGHLQAKLLLRATALHLRHGIAHLFPFALIYPPSPTFTFIDPGRKRRPVWHAMQRFMAACAPKQRCVEASLDRPGALSANLRDLAIATPEGFTYCIWQETAPDHLKDDAPPQIATVTLRCPSGKPIALASVVDPITGQAVAGARATPAGNGDLALSLPVTDYPRLVTLRLGG